ncbi:hypothetical protein SDC9_33126 [bioreactor metagenome]|uniref:DNA methylase N-4/N-6 domain-containing protein n=1 Tax=bioreactor metagenome TaxID=1076179 RepID=A0A644V8P0_9ZZZZ
MDKLYWTTEKRVVSDLIPLDFNPRKVNEKKQKQLISSLDEFNLVDILVINKNDQLISGHRRIEALILAGRSSEEIDVRVPNRLLTENEVKRYNLLANTHAGEWDIEMLNEYFADIDYQDILNDIPDFKPEELMPAEMITAVAEQRETIEDEFDELPPENPITQLNDLYELNGHRLYCADSTNVDAVGRLMAGKLATMIFTDPPYNVRVKDISSMGKIKHKEFAMASGEMSRFQFIKFLEDIFSNQIRYSKKGSIHFVCMDWKHILEITTAGQLFTELKNLIVWNKTNGGMGSFYRSKHELIFVFQNESTPDESHVDALLDEIDKHGYLPGHKLIYVFKNGKEKHINNFGLGQTGRYRTNVWDYNGFNSTQGAERKEMEGHPTPKPVKMVADAMIDCSNPGDIIQDLFIGSGTSIIAAEQVDRLCYGQELSPAFCDLTIRRYIRFMRQMQKPISITRNGIKLSISQLKEYEK